MKTAINIARIIVGLLFIFSGLVKANDPLGLSYKMQEFFEAWQLSGFHDYTLTMSILMNAFEIIAGVFNVITPIQSQFEGHVLNIVGYNVGPQGELKWVKIENTWGEAEGLNGFYVVDVASFKAFFQAMSVLDGVKFVEKNNLPGKMITK